MTRFARLNLERSSAMPNDNRSRVEILVREASEDRLRIEILKVLNHQMSEDYLTRMQVLGVLQDIVFEFKEQCIGKASQ